MAKKIPFPIVTICHFKIHYLVYAMINDVVKALIKYLTIIDVYGSAQGEDHVFRFDQHVLSARIQACRPILLSAPVGESGTPQGLHGGRHLRIA